MIFLALFAVAWLWIVNGRPRTFGFLAGYMIVTCLCALLGYGGAHAWTTGG
jgi:hypothetical protein